MERLRMPVIPKDACRTGEGKAVRPRGSRVGHRTPREVPNFDGCGDTALS